jgi:hypothetical protein
LRVAVPHAEAGVTFQQLSVQVPAQLHVVSTSSGVIISSTTAAANTANTNCNHQHLVPCVRPLELDSVNRRNARGGCCGKRKQMQKMASDNDADN